MSRFLAYLRSRWVARVAIVFFVMAVPLFLITTNLRIIINSGWLYSFGYDHNDSVALSGIEKPDLMRIAEDIKTYFNNNKEPLQLRPPYDDLFTDREVTHMKDVKGLVRGLAFWQRVTFVYMAGFIAIGALLWGRRELLRRLAHGVLWGSVLALVLIVAAGLGSLVGFDTLFEKFHTLSFSNDFWQLNDNDYLLRIFPEGFFLDATLIVAAMTFAQAALGATASAAYLLRRRPTPAACAGLSSVDQTKP
ncbi:MAG: TIGR01906 family membrane protein [Chloroflexi bacterium]|nr:TIGR01906 family membrane protein [Chloroflexota bacterium]